ncbi:hypothetical protein M885DRAFT_558321 [Pelagophyceae sp. CCMP2097]|nr:hypothetical protein M885DRAFT_558321 [Pelagophyceae sp. CCMP2097]
MRALRRVRKAASKATGKSGFFSRKPPNAESDDDGEAAAVFDYDFSKLPPSTPLGADELFDALRLHGGFSSLSRGECRVLSTFVVKASLDGTGRFLWRGDGASCLAFVLAGEVRVGGAVSGAGAIFGAGAVLGEVEYFTGRGEARLPEVEYFTGLPTFPSTRRLRRASPKIADKVEAALADISAIKNVDQQIKAVDGKPPKLEARLCASSTRWKRKTPKAPSAFRSVRVSLVDVAVVEFVPSVGGWAVVLTARCAGARHTRAPKAHFALLDATVTYVDVARPWAVPESASASAPRSLVSAALRSENDDQKTAFYSIGVGLEPHAQWAVRRRYRQFLELARRLEEAGFAAQPLPPRRVWWLTLSDGVLSERRDALDEFRCAVVADARLRDSPATIDFLGARDVPSRLLLNPDSLRDASPETVADLHRHAAAVEAVIRALAAHPDVHADVVRLLRRRTAARWQPRPVDSNCLIKK